MTPRNIKPWIEVYPFNERKVNVYDSRDRVTLSPELSNYCNKLWEPKAKKGWKSSWVAFAKNLSFYKSISDDLTEGVTVSAGAMPFHVVDGINKSIQNEEPFAPKSGYVSSLSVGFLTATKDGKVIFQRRAPDVNCPNILIHEPCGYIASMAFAPKAECDLEKYANDKRLFDIKEQLNFRKKEIAETFNVPEELVTYKLNQDFLAAGWLTTEIYFSTTGKIGDSEQGLIKSLFDKITKLEKGDEKERREAENLKKQEFFFVPFEHLKDLIYNQGRLSKINPEGYRPENPRDIPLLDESLIGLIYGYEKLTGEKLNIEETVNRLNKSGLEITVHDTSPGKVYEFPSKF